jgi:4-hydroxybenzoate polyprenyltransferase
LPRFGFFVVAFVLVLIILVVIVAEIIVLVDVIVDVVIDAKNIRKDERVICHELGSEAGLTFSRFGGGYVDQK